MVLRTGVEAQSRTSYLQTHSTPPDELTRALVDETHVATGEHAVMQVTAHQAALLGMLAGLAGTRQAVEVGTFTGLSALAVARVLPTDGRLTCFDTSTEYTQIAQRYWQRAGVADRVDLRLGPAVERLPELPDEPHLDFVFLDADKQNYPEYWELLVPRVRSGGLLAVDNVLWGDWVLAQQPEDANTQALQQFNARVAADPRVEAVMLPVGDGLTLARRR